MNLDDLINRLDSRALVLGALALSCLALVWVVRRVRKIAKSDRPDDALSNLAMLTGFGWSSEAVWVLAGPEGADLPTPIRISLFCIFEVILVVFMIRAKRNMRTINRPGRAGRNAWFVAAGMSLVAVTTAHNLGEAFLRLLVPILLTSMWWDGLVGDGARKSAGATSWRWTPRRLLLALGAIEPGERDIETVHRERLTQQMTRLEFRRRHGSARQQKASARKLARLSLTADDEVITDVQQRVDRAVWFEATRPGPANRASRASVPAAVAASHRRRRVRHGRALRRVMVAHPRPVIVAAQKTRQDDRATHEIDTIVRVARDALPKVPLTQIARLTSVSEPTVRRALRRTQNPAPPPTTNGRRPELEGADR